MFHPKQQIFLQLTRGALISYTNKGEQARLDFPTSVVQNMEVIDQAKLAELVAGFADKYGLRGKKLMLVLDDSIVFQKIVPLAADADPTSLQTDFQEKIPLATDTQRVLALKLKDQLVMFGTNGDYYLQVVQTLASRGAKIQSVAPLTLFTKGASKPTPEIFEKVASNQRLVEVANFLNLEHKK